MTDEVAYHVAIKFDIIRKLAVGFDFGNPGKPHRYLSASISLTGWPVICFELFTPPVFQEEQFNRLLTGDEFQDNRKYRQRLQSLNGAHAAVAPYAHHLRVILHDQRDLAKFSELCVTAKIPRPIRATVEANANSFYSERRLFHLRK